MGRPRTSALLPRWQTVEGLADYLHQATRLYSLAKPQPYLGPPFFVACMVAASTRSVVCFGRTYYRILTETRNVNTRTSLRALLCANRIYTCKYKLHQHKHVAVQLKLHYDTGQDDADSEAFVVAGPYYLLS